MSLNDWQNSRFQKPFFFSLALLCLAASCLAGEKAAATQTEPAPPPIRKPEPILSAGREEIPDWQARWELARVYGYAKRYDESIAEFRKLLEKKPDLLAAKLELAQVLYWHGRHEESFALVNAIDFEKLDVPSRLLLADLYAARREHDKAEAIYRAHLKTTPKDTAVRLRLADLLSWQKKYEESLAIFARLLEETPGDIQLRRKYAFVLIWAGQHEKGAEELKKTLKEKIKEEPSPSQQNEPKAGTESQKSNQEMGNFETREASDRERPVMSEPQ